MAKRVTVCVVIGFVLFAPVPQAGAATTKPATTRSAAARAAAATTQAAADSLDALLEPIRAKHKLPGLVAAIVEGDDVIAIGATGIRKLGAPDAITVNDKVHLGSCTKAMTATVIARLIERKQLAWDSTLAQVFPDLAPELNEPYRAITLEQLLQHRSGVSGGNTWVLLARKDQSPPEQRLNVVKTEFGKPPVTKPGTHFEYANAGYVATAAMAERVTGRSWEELIQAELFDPLGMSSAGFGAPGAANQVDQPWGHVSVGSRAMPVQGDNPPVIGPAGRVHCTIRDWAKFVSLHLRGARGEEHDYLKPETFARLHSPTPGGDYADGWMVLERPWGGGTVLSHSGSNTMWYCVVWVAPKRDFAALSATNIAGDEAARGCDDASAAMIGRFFKLRPNAKLPTTRGAR